MPEGIGYGQGVRKLNTPFGSITADTTDEGMGLNPLGDGGAPIAPPVPATVPSTQPTMGINPPIDGGRSIPILPNPNPQAAEQTFNEWFSKTYDPETRGTVQDFNGEPILMERADDPLNGGPDEQAIRKAVQGLKGAQQGDALMQGSPVPDQGTVDAMQQDLAAQGTPGNVSRPITNVTPPEVAPSIGTQTQAIPPTAAANSATPPAAVTPEPALLESLLNYLGGGLDSVNDGLLRFGGNVSNDIDNLVRRPGTGLDNSIANTNAQVKAAQDAGSGNAGSALYNLLLGKQ